MQGMGGSLICYLAHRGEFSSELAALGDNGAPMGLSSGPNLLNAQESLGEKSLALLCTLFFSFPGRRENLGGLQYNRSTVLM